MVYESFYAMTVASYLWFVPASLIGWWRFAKMNTLISRTSEAFKGKTSNGDKALSQDPFPIFDAWGNGVVFDLNVFSWEFLACPTQIDYCFNGPVMMLMTLFFEETYLRENLLKAGIDDSLLLLQPSVLLVIMRRWATGFGPKGRDPDDWRYVDPIWSWW